MVRRPAAAIEPRAVVVGYDPGPDTADRLRQAIEVVLGAARAAPPEPASRPSAASRSAPDR